MDGSKRMLLAAMALSAAQGAAAQETGGGFVSEVRVGMTQHDIDFLPDRVEEGQALNAEILFAPVAEFDRFGSIHPHLGGTVALEGETDHVYAGLTWTVHPFDEGAFAPLWLSAFGGGAVHNGEIDNAGPGEKALGSRALFRFGFEAGYRVTRNVNLSAYYAHISSAWLAEPNPGLEHAGVRVGWRF